MHELFRSLPSVDFCLDLLEKHAITATRTMQRTAVTQFLDGLRHDIKHGIITDKAHVDLNVILEKLIPFVLKATQPRLRRVINGTGVVIHTNMGRSVLAKEAVDAVTEAIASYSTLELDLATGGRGSRQNIVEALLCHITGAEAALVVNNNAAAVLLTLDSLCKGGEVIVSRGQLVEIGGSFRIPEVMEKSGALLREVGATNRTHAHDYRNAINEHTVALLRVHTSNYRIVGFHKEVSLQELVALGHEYGLPVIEDLGSGSLVDLRDNSLPDEPTVQATIQAGATLVTFSGDKVLGGPQAGIIVGQKDYIERLRSNPLHRALRSDKCTLAALEATLRIYTDIESARKKIPTLRMITMSQDILAKQAAGIQTKLQKSFGRKATFSLHEDVSRVGGGAFPERDLPTTLVRIRVEGFSANTLKEKLLTTTPPLLGRLEDDNFCIDPRTLSDEDILDIERILHQLITEKELSL